MNGRAPIFTIPANIDVRPTAAIAIKRQRSAASLVNPTNSFQVAGSINWPSTWRSAEGRHDKQPKQDELTNRVESLGMIRDRYGVRSL